MRPGSDRPSPSSESGLISVGAVIALAIGALFIYLLLAAFEEDPSHYGAVAIPGKQVPIELPKGETDIFYAEAIEGDSSIALAPPEDLQFQIVGEDGAGVQVDSRGGEPEATDDGIARVIGAAFPPEKGTYFVDVESAELAQRVAPSITFGQSPFGAVKERFDEIVEEMKGPTGIVVAVVLVILFLVPRIQLALRTR